VEVRRERGIKEWMEGGQRNGVKGDKGKGETRYGGKGERHIEGNRNIGWSE
jgi:hypothetical protein